MSAPVTPETLTDEEIREEWHGAPRSARWDACQMILDCDTALHRDGTASEIAAARRRICDAINARRAKERP